MKSQVKALREKTGFVGLINSDYSQIMLSENAFSVKQFQKSAFEKNGINTTLKGSFC